MAGQGCSAGGARHARISGDETCWVVLCLPQPPNERRSQHAFANAIDLPVFYLADGRRVDLATGWGPTRRDLVAGVKLVPIVAKTTTADAEVDAIIPAK